MDTKNKNMRSPSCDLLPTRKQLERDIAQRFNAFNYKMLGSRAKKMTCTIFNNYLTVVGDEAMTPIEEIIYKNGQVEIIQAIRENVNRGLKQQLDLIIQELVQVEPVDSFCQLSLGTGRLIGFAILSEVPLLRIKHSRIKDQLTEAQGASFK